MAKKRAPSKRLQLLNAAPETIVALQLAHLKDLPTQTLALALATIVVLGLIRILRS